METWYSGGTSLCDWKLSYNEEECYLEAWIRISEKVEEEFKGYKKAYSDVIFIVPALNFEDTDKGLVIRWKYAFNGDRNKYPNVIGCAFKDIETMCDFEKIKEHYERTHIV
ncbi:MAG: hypothetical protein LBM93_14670 [Oscillospiraceae bacterium]|jgi:hypothetical protein|nr:hypothetical protein [Oscillospiraceae bacterium]